MATRPTHAAADTPGEPPPDHGGGREGEGGARLVATFNAVRGELLSTLYYMLGNRDDAQDAAQEAFLKCWRGREALPGVDNLKAWVFRVALNTARDGRRSAWSRRVKPLAGEEAMIANPDPDPGAALEDREALAKLRDAIAKLRPDEQEVFLLRQNGELTYEQIAEARNCPVGTVKTQMRAALQKLRLALNPADPAEPAAV